MEGHSRWCRVRTPGDDSVESWMAGRYLTEAAASDGRTLGPSDTPGAPELSVRASGEIEVRFKTGCDALYGADGSRIAARGGCSAEQLRQAAEAVRAYPR